MKLQDKINELEIKIQRLEAKVNAASINTEEKPKPNYSVVGQDSKATLNPTDISSGRAIDKGSFVIWNNTDVDLPRFGQIPKNIPTIGYNKHTHSRYSGGALIKNGLEIVEYKQKSLENIHNQQFKILNEDLDIEEIKNSQNKNVKKIGNLDLVFNPDTRTWRSGGSSEIDVETTYFVKRVTQRDNDELESQGQPIQELGAIIKDSKGQEMKSPLLYMAGNSNTLEGRNENLNKSNVYWDEDAQCWRFYAIFKPYPEEE